LRATAAVRLIELGCSEDLAAAVTGTAISTSCVGMYAVPTRGNWPAKPCGSWREVNWTFKGQFCKSAKPVNEVAPNSAKQH
jgi:hypothetical protein